tara:strand:- start:15353 stop:16630 length:1278 start_codon:yes stop_codon:yes gene_type:complete
MNINDRIKSVILSKMVKPKNRKIGMEEECIIYTADHRRLPVNPCKEFSAYELLIFMNKNSHNNGSYTLEPGGQLEWSSPPYNNLNDLDVAFKKHRTLLELIVSEQGLRIIHMGVEPNYVPDDIDLIDQLKYQLMNKNMEKRGNLGKWMMRNTASIQVNYDITSEKDLEEMVFVADCLHPVCAYLFANSPFQDKKPIGEKNIRNTIWDNTDGSRCRNLIDHGINSPQGLIDKYIEYTMTVPGIFQLNQNGDIENTNQTLGERLNEINKLGQLKADDIQAALHQIFTNVRLKNLVEVRGADRPPEGHEMAPVAFWTGLLTDKSIRDEIISIIKKWSLSDRKKWNKAALNMDLSQQGPDGKSYGEWNKWAGDMALKGLELRQRNESHLFKRFFNIVLEKGPFGLQTQHAFKLSNKILNDFIFETETLA